MRSYIAIAGNIGVGKSTLTEILHRKLGWEPFFEAVVENPFLADFYQDMPRYAFHSQVFFLTRRLRSHRELMDRAGVVVQDRSVYEDAEVFARNLFLQGKMTPRDYQTYRDLYEVLTLLLPPPDLVVYLRASVTTLIDRIGRRGRDFEREIAPEYLSQLNNLYDEWVRSFTLAPVLTVPADRLNFVLNDCDLDLLIGKIQLKLRGEQLVLFD